ncbi:hypothetical protein ACI2J5_00090 [Agrobacterium pusense]|uniref:hypothetical protein n=1 Tax=Agrobacterium pusense TaxID=648995 RepID=UPI00384BCC08
MQSEEPTIIQSLENHLAEYGHTTVGQDIAAAILVIKDLHQNAALSAAEPVGYTDASELSNNTGHGLFAYAQSDTSWLVGNPIALYAATPAPSVAVKALEWIVQHPEESNASVWDVAKNALSAQVQDVADSAFQAIADERLRQIGKGYDAAHDDRHVAGEIISATWGASARLWDAQECAVSGDIAGYKKYLIQAAAQIVAEYGRVERAAAPAKQEG